MLALGLGLAFFWALVVETVATSGDTFVFLRLETSVVSEARFVVPKFTLLYFTFGWVAVDPL